MSEQIEDDEQVVSLKIELDATVTAGHIAANATDTEIVNLIIDLERYTRNYAATELLYRHFSSLREQALTTDPGLSAESKEELDRVLMLQPAPAGWASAESDDVQSEPPSQEK